MEDNVVVIGIGSNIAAESSIGTALRLLGKYVELLAVSSLETTKPIGITDQPDFVNGAVKARTLLQIDTLKKLLKQIEDEMGRDRTAPKFGPRIIDMDIVIWNGEVVDNDYYERDFMRRVVDEVLGLKF